jgi:hypothetical protein
MEVHVRSRNTFLLFSLIAVVAVVAVWWLTRPTPYETVYDTITLGMTERDVEQIMSRPNLARDEDSFTGRFVSVHWDRLHDGQPYRLFLTDEAALERDPVYRASWAEHDRFHWRNVDEWTEESIDGSSHVVLKFRYWVRDGNSLTVAYDSGGRVIEKGLWTRAPESAWLQRLKHYLWLEE